jgi:hypothetical protein
MEMEALRAEHLLAWLDVPRLLQENLSAVLSDQIAPERRQKAAELLQRYVGLYPGSRSLTAEAKARFEESVAPGKTGPYRGEIEDALAKMGIYASGIRMLFGQYEVTGAEAALDEMDRQFADYEAWAKATVLPLSREDFREPPELYPIRLKIVGVGMDPETLMADARAEFYETRAAMAMLAGEVAPKVGLDAGTSYQEVIAALKKGTIPNDKLEATYADVIERLEEFIRRDQVISLPDYGMRMRLATLAESAATPVPYMMPPPLIGNTGERGTFVLPLSVPTASGEALMFDDFNYPAAAWSLSAHEGRPGHELQFAAMVDRGVSLARALFAYNSVNVEGWGLYAEAEMIPFEPPEGQLIALQFRLLRAARAFLDPMLNLGLIEIADAERILSQEVSLSPAMVRQEISRYTFGNVGQATSYFYGYSRLLDLRVKTEIALGARFDRKAFNDFVLGQGLLAPDLLAKAVAEEFIPAHRTQ